MLDKDWKIIKQCLAGQTGNFEELIDRYQKPIFNLAYRMVSDIQDAEDITQTVFIKAYESLNSFNPKYKFFSWIYRMAINETLNVINKKKQLSELDQNVVSHEKLPDAYYEEKELSHNIQAALMNLKADYREVIVLKHLQGVSYKEMSRILSIPEKTVKSRLFSARLLLKDLLINNGIVI